MVVFRSSLDAPKRYRDVWPDLHELIRLPDEFTVLMPDTERVMKHAVSIVPER
jgi:hypothetical protein